MADISIIKPKKSTFFSFDPQSIATWAASPAGQAAAVASQQPALSTDPAPTVSFTMNKSNPIRNRITRETGCACGRPSCGDDPEDGGERDCGDCNGNVAIKKHKRTCLRRDPGWETSYCPPWGPVVAATATSAYDVKCTYQYINPDLVFGPGASAVAENFDAAVSEGFQKKYCMSLKNPDDLLAKKNDCKDLFGAGTDVEFDKRILELCAAVSGVGWASMTESCVETARRSVQNNDSNAGAASALMNKFCRGGAGTDKTANGTGNHRADPRCGCINAHDLGFKGAGNCLEAANQSLPGCDKMYTKMKPLVESGGPGLQAIQAFTTDPGCIAEDCELAKQPAEPNHIFPYYGAGSDCADVQFNICDIQINQRVAMNSAVQAQCSFPEPPEGGGGGGGGGSSTPGAAGAPGMAPVEEPKELPITWAPFAKIFDSETKQYAFMSSCCVTCLLLVVLLIFMMKGPSGPSSSNLLSAKLASI